jgi:hypothetical protein
MSVLTRMRRRMALDEMATAMLDTVADLERAGCRVLEAALLPMPRCRIDRPPPGLETYAWVRPVAWDAGAPVQHYTVVDGVRVSWQAGGAR